MKIKTFTPSTFDLDDSGWSEYLEINGYAVINNILEHSRKDEIFVIFLFEIVRVEKERRRLRFGFLEKQKESRRGFFILKIGGKGFCNKTY